MYADYEYKKTNYSALENIFGNSLRTVYNNVDLWRLYLRYIKETNASKLDEDPSEQKSKKTLIAKAFETAISAIGFSFISGPLWSDYIEYLKETKVKY